MTSRLQRLWQPTVVIALAQLLGTSLWFSVNSAAPELSRAWGANPTDIGWLTNATQVGFILGTLVLGLGGVGDHFRASSLFVVGALLGAVFNAAFVWFADGIAVGALIRFLVGLCLAGIYPMGMKLIVSWAPERTGMALAQLVAMLTLGTALPHALREAGTAWPWQAVIFAASVFSLLGAGLIWRLGDGPHLARPSAKDSHQSPTSRKPHGILKAFRIRAFRAAAFGYFGHMWELYAFWTIVPLAVAQTQLAIKIQVVGVAGISFSIIAMGAVGCLFGGLLSRRVGSAAVALGALALSGNCALVFVLFWQSLPAAWLWVLLLFWGATVVADSPQFSALSAQACPRESVGSALAFQNAIGFALTVVSIACTTTLLGILGLKAIWLLVLGPVLGLSGFLIAIRS